MEFRRADSEARERFKILSEHISLKRALLVTGIDRDYQGSVGCEEVDCRLNRRHRGLTHRIKRLSSASRKVTEIEHSCLDGTFNVFLYVVVRVAYKGIIFGAAPFFEVLCGRIHRALLNIERVNVSALSDCL